MIELALSMEQKCKCCLLAVSNSGLKECNVTCKLCGSVIHLVMNVPSIQIPSLTEFFFFNFQHTQSRCLGVAFSSMLLLLYVVCIFVEAARFSDSIFSTLQISNLLVFTSAKNCIKVLASKWQASVDFVERKI